MKQSRWNGAPVINVTLLREPRQHVLSQYMMCVHAAPWISSLDRPDFLLASTDPSAPILEDALFKAWLRFFTTGWHPRAFHPDLQRKQAHRTTFPADWVLTTVEGRSVYVQASTGQAAENPPFENPQALLATARNQHGDWGCYHPRNMQTRQLSAQCHQSPHHIMAHNFEPLQTAAALDSAAAELGRLGFVGILELYPLSICLLLHTLGAPELPPFCHDQAALAGALTHEVHGVPRYSIAEVSPESLTLVDELTAQDAQLYAQGKRRLLGEYDAYQRLAAATGRPALGKHLLQPSAG